MWTYEHQAYIYLDYFQKEKQSMLKWIWTRKVDTLKSPMDCFYSINVMCLILTWILKHWLCAPTHPPTHTHLSNIQTQTRIWDINLMLQHLIKENFCMIACLVMLEKCLEYLLRIIVVVLLNHNLFKNVRISLLRRHDFVSLCWK